jgi:hypothetical protein
MRQIGRRSLFPVLAGLLALTLAACGGGGGEEAEVQTTESGQKMVEAAGMTFEWSIDGDTIEMTVTSPEQGWVAVGFDPETIMKGANMILGYVEDGEVTVGDHYGDQLTNHSSDEELGGSDHVTVIDGSEDESGTTISFSIPLDSGDEYDKALEEGQTHTVMLAYGTEDNFTEQHPSDGRATVEVEL